MPTFSKQSLDKLSTCDVRLQALFNEVIKITDCTILVGHRNQQDQDAAFASHKSQVKWPNSNHNTTPSQAADVMPYPIDWNDKDGIKQFSDTVKATAVTLGIPIKWGGDFPNFYDGDHYELA